ncbi:MAG: nucleotidyltransferase domain-containing protein [Candidatus Omnitrophica bacterium]|nr:nucleotidyltransferase domain-containing protein [Candidatus Omnitrophota bacterium]MBU1869093.1 nucleotidyltransferase domain-containing protein [Candidatus Omnitrophota bacterium]
MTVFPEIGKSRLRRALLGYFCTNSDARLYLRQAAVILGEDPGNLSKELTHLESIGIFSSTLSGKQRYYSLNKQYPLFNELKSVVFKTIGVEAALKEMVISLSGLSKAFIYGSFAKDEEKAQSDIDILLVGNFSEDELIKKLTPLESKLQREINYTIYSPQEFAKKSKIRGSFLSEVLKTKFILLKGKLNA